MDQRELNALCERVVDRFDVPGTASYRDVCHRVGAVTSELLDARVEVTFIAMRSGISGATARRQDGTYVIYCAKSRSWYHRLGILLHELAHLLLGHQPVVLSASERLRQFAPHLPGKMARIIAQRTAHTEDDERQAEEFADKLLERLTEPRTLNETTPDTKPHVMRIAEGLAHDPGWGKRGDR
jgi:hypothetical protein